MDHYIAENFQGEGKKPQPRPQQKETKEIKQATKAQLDSLLLDIRQPSIQASPIPKLFESNRNKLYLYPHKGPKYGQPVRGSVACYVHAANLMKMAFNCFPSDTNKIFENRKEEPKFKAATYIPKLIQEKSLPVGTVFWIKGNLKINDPKSMNAKAKNHWFILAGFQIEQNGARTPLFLDQGSMGSEKPRPITQILGTKDRYLHKAYMPDPFLK